MVTAATVAALRRSPGPLLPRCGILLPIGLTRLVAWFSAARDGVLVKRPGESTGSRLCCSGVLERELRGLSGNEGLTCLGGGDSPPQLILPISSLSSAVIPIQTL